MRKSSELELDAFLKLPRRAQLFLFDDLSKAWDKKSNIWKYSVIDFDTSECKSPIEQILLFAFELYTVDENPECLTLDPQFEVIGKSGKTYIADFSISNYNTAERLPILIECDGHEFHQKTKAQVKHDNERDFDLKMAGYDVLHFSGSQIYNDPFKCVKDIYDYANEYSKKHGLNSYESN